MILVPNGSNYNPLHKSTNHIGRQIDAKDPHLVALRWFVHPQKRGGENVFSQISCSHFVKKSFKGFLKQFCLGMGSMNRREFGKYPLANYHIAYQGTI